MKILLVQDTDWINKGPLQQNHLMERLSLKGHKIRVIDHEILWREQNGGGLLSKRQVFYNLSRIYEGAQVDLIRPGIIKAPTLDYLSLFISRRKEIDLQIKEFKPDVIIGFQILSAYLGMSAARKNHIPFIYYWIDVYHTQLHFEPYQLIGKLFEYRTLRGANKIVAINEKLKEYVIQMGSDPANTCINRGSVDLNRFNLNVDNVEIKNRYNIKDSDNIICFVGMFHKDLGLKEVTLGLTKVTNPNIKLLLVGKGDQHWPNAVEELQKIAKENGLNGRVILTGKIPYHEIPQIMNVASVCILPAFNSGLMRDIVPIKMYEYMAMGKPVISTKLPGVMKEFKDENGVHYVDNPSGILEKAIELIEDNKLREEGVKARKFVMRYSWENVVDEFEDILNEIKI